MAGDIALLRGLLIRSPLVYKANIDKAEQDLKANGGTGAVDGALDFGEIQKEHDKKILQGSVWDQLSGDQNLFNSVAHKDEKGNLVINADDISNAIKGGKLNIPA